MPKIKGGKTSIKKLKKTTAKSTGDFSEIWNIKANEALTVRFLTEPDEWFGYEEYWDDDAGTYVPVVDGDEPNKDARLKYLVCAVILDNDRSVALKLPKSLANTLLSRYDKFGTVMDREYELVREGQGLDTKYEAINEGPSKFNFKKYEKSDLLEVLEKEWMRSNLDDDDDEYEDSRPNKKKKKKSKSKSKSKKGKKSKKKNKKKDSGKKGRKRGQPEEEPDEDEEDEEYEEVWEEDELVALKLLELRDIAKGLGVKTSGQRKADLVEAILEEQPF